MRYVMLVLRAGAGAGLFAVDRHRDPFEHFFVFSGPHTGGGPLKIRPNESPAYGLLRVERARQRLRPPLQPHLGLGAVLHQQQPARAGGPELFDNQRIRLAAAGDCHLAVVAEDGAVYICGGLSRASATRSRGGG